MEERKLYIIDEEFFLNKREKIMKEASEKIKETETVHKTTQNKNQSLVLDLEKHKYIERVLHQTWD